MTPQIPRRARLPLDLVLLLADSAVLGARLAVSKWERRRRIRQGDTLKPGPETPLWNALAVAITSEFGRRGERARLARILELPRQRVTEFFRGRRQLPDAERTLILLLWLQARRGARDGKPSRLLSPRPIA